VDVGRSTDVDLDEVVGRGSHLGSEGDGVERGEGASDFHFCCRLYRSDHSLNLCRGGLDGRETGIGITRRQACQGAGGKQTSSFENHGRRRGLVLGEHAGLVETLTAGGM